MSLYETVKTRYDACINQATELAQKGVAEGRNLSVEEKNTFDGLMAEAEGHGERMKSIADGEKRAKDLEDSYRGGAGEKPEQRTAGESALGKWAREARVGDSFVLPAVLGAERRALARVRGGSEYRAMDATGGVGIDGVYGQLWEFAVAGSQILQAGCDVINTTDGNDLPLPAVTAHATGASAAASAPITASDAVLTTVTLPARKYGYLTLVPSELVADTNFDLEGYLARAAGRELGKIISKVAADAAIAGFTVSGATATASGIAGNNILSDALIDLFHSVLPEYRTTSAFVMNDVWAAMVRKAKDGSGQYVWERSLVPGNPGMIDGKGVYTSPDFPTAKTSTTKAVYFGDWSALKVRIAGGLRFERSTEYKFGNDQVAYRALVRTGAVAVDVNAVKYLVLTA